MFLEHIYRLLNQSAANIYNHVRSINCEDLPLFKEIEIETLNRCNGKCSFCPVNATQPQREYAKMTSELFYSIINQLAELDYSGKISLFSNNEPFLDERIVEFQKYIREKLPKAKCCLYTNGTLLTLDLYLEIIKYLDLLVIDDYSNDRSLSENIREISDYISNDIELKRKTTISLRLQDEVLSSRGGSAPNKKKGKLTPCSCWLPFSQAIVRPTGEMSLCCNDPLGKMTLGDLRKDSILDAWDSDKRIEICKELQKNGRKNLELCKNCDVKGGIFERDFFSFKLIK